ncbi:hypothetical protein Q8791_20020 [Nocardiopsis sp. CT-R113]|uniref:Uncharacterized protein n=1 Tax=Nocardiopsis codii TaxID=3065942 RepID=A0ABU7KBD1_9ACTN|nr:hypothetical protein [Nocardiopsis sp. CT-R113]MEE2039512.1 hypothetical protein [Nocardiopsis sp. CT-R113]
MAPGADVVITSRDGAQIAEVAKTLTEAHEGRRAVGWRPVPLRRVTWPGCSR